jgi:pyruvate dehydrogenase E2 component (dihydrolipoamide acetyltransferase)
MATQIQMPKLSDTMEEGKILKWLKKEGDVVEQGEIIAEVESDKADMELEAYDSGILLKIVIPEGKGAPVGGVIAVIGEKGESVDIDEKGSESKKVTEKAGESEDVKKEKRDDKTTRRKTDSEKIEEEEAEVSSTPERGGDGVLRISPLARRMADDHNIDLKSLKGSGPEGRIVKRDIEAYLEGGRVSAGDEPTKPAVSETIELTGMRKAIARRMVESKTTVPHFYLTVEVDMERTIEFRNRINDTLKDEKVSFTDIILKLTAAALQRHPRVNSYWAGDTIKRRGDIHIGLAVALEDGLITPVIRNCDRKGIVQISKEVREYAERARAKKLKPEEYEGGCITVSNLGMFEIDYFSAIINPPESAILAIGSIVEKPVIKNGQIVPGKNMTITMSCDHRVVDGAVGAEFLRDLKKMLEDPAMTLI